MWGMGGREECYYMIFLAINRKFLKEINQMAIKYDILSKGMQNKILIRKSLFQLDTQWWKHW